MIFAGSLVIIYCAFCIYGIYVECKSNVEENLITLQNRTIEDGRQDYNIEG